MKSLGPELVDEFLFVKEEQKVADGGTVVKLIKNRID